MTKDRDHPHTVMFSKHPEHVLADVSSDLRDEQDWKLGSLRILDFPLDITSLAVEPVMGLLAVGMYLLTLLVTIHIEHSTRYIQWGHIHLWQCRGRI